MLKKLDKGENLDLTAGTYVGNDIPKKTKWVYSVSGMFRDALYALVSGFLMNYIMYSGVLSDDAAEYSKQITVISVLFIVFLVWDGINDPLFGIILEKCHLKTGKFRPWILIGGVLNSIVVACMFAIRPTGWAFVTFWAIFYFLWDAVFTLNDIGYWAMLPSMTSDEKKRNEVTTLMSIFVSIGSFSMYAICSFLPKPENYTYIYGWIAVIASVLFGLSQIAVFFLCKERKRDPKQEAISKDTKLRDLFILVKKNKPLRTSVIAILVYYTGSSLMIGVGMTYFYLVYGYGGDYGGSIMMVFTVMYVIGTLGAQFLFKPLSKKFKKKTLLTASAWFTIAAYLAFFIVGVPLFGAKPLAYNSTSGATGLGFAFGGTMWMVYVPTILFFAGEGVFYLVLLLMMQNSIEYNEWAFGERKESVAFSWRPLDAKFGSAIQKGLIYVMLLVSGLFTVTNQISSGEQKMDAEISALGANRTTEAVKAIQDKYTAEITNTIGNIEPQKLVILGSFMIFSIIACILAAWLVIEKGYHLDEVQYAQIVKELEERHKADEAEAEGKTCRSGSGFGNEAR
jgi:Na+/melibiose symporter-like transporter